MGKKKKSEEMEIEITSITRSFARKLNMSAHGGKQYETADIACTLTANVGEGDAEEMSAALMQMCIEDVNATISALDEETLEEEEVEDAPVAKKKKIVDLGIKIDQEEIEGISVYINDLTLSKGADDLKAAVKKIKGASEDMSDIQKKYLSAYYVKRKEAISE